MKGGKALSNQMKERDAREDARYDASATAAAKPSFAETQREDEYKKHVAWKQNHDYTSPPPGLIAMNFGDPAMAQRMRERTANATPTGLMAWGAEANPTALGLAKENIAAHGAEDVARQYESDVRAEDTYQRTGAADSLISSDWARKAHLLDSASGMSQFATQARINTQPKSILPALLSAGIGAAGMALGGPLGASLFGGGGGRQPAGQPG